ncbi:MAG: hypothetical protein ACXIU5_02085 [Halomonadaceae bacterium]|jgi:hypothetical protein|uniref:hypothetical protein n=1 Tax=Halomonas sp. MCCC 1A11062 TaxID=2733485 RepID=UPI001F438586|nr:hypothetical protein [Halomonas sp. MCCC 1A11062]MCE8040299.1 hypothetical protein [Halomonas sp. MCCC 1A11062]
MSEPTASGETFALEWVPKQLFPDIELERVEIADTATRVICRDGDWSLQSDITPFWGRTICKALPLARPLPHS